MKEMQEMWGPSLGWEDYLEKEMLEDSASPRGTKGDLAQINQLTPKPQQRFFLQRVG